MTHEEVLPPVPLSEIASLGTSPLAASITGFQQRQHWLFYLDLMELESNANHSELLAIRNDVTLGVSLPLLKSPSSIIYKNTLTVVRHASAVRTRLLEYILINAVTILPDTFDCRDLSIQPLHVILKENKKPRVVIDLSRNLNPYLEYNYFKYSCVEDAVDLSYPNCWYAKLDLSNCFLSFPLHPDVRKFFIFRFEEQLYQFIAMPFGLSTAPRVCTLLLSVVSFALTRLSIIHVRYLDDILLIGSTHALVSLQLAQAEGEITRFGLVVNKEKTEGPAQRLTFLGIVLDSTVQTLSCTATRLTELSCILSRAVPQLGSQRKRFCL